MKRLEFCIATLQTGSFTIQNFVSQPKAVYCVNRNDEQYYEQYVDRSIVNSKIRNFFLKNQIK